MKPEDLAIAWWNMSADEQAQFFNALNRTHLPIQLLSICHSQELKISGRCAMQFIGDYVDAD